MKSNLPNLLEEALNSSSLVYLRINKNIRSAVTAEPMYGRRETIQYNCLFVSLNSIKILKSQWMIHYSFKYAVYRTSHIRFNYLFSKKKKKEDGIDIIMLKLTGQRKTMSWSSCQSCPSRLFQ